MQLFVCAQELHTLKVTGQETVTQIKSHVGITLKDQVLLLAHMTLEDEAKPQPVCSGSADNPGRRRPNAGRKSSQLSGPCRESERPDSQGGQAGEEEDWQGEATNSRHFVNVVPTFNEKNKKSPKC